MPAKQFFSPTFSGNTPVSVIGIDPRQEGWSKRFVGTAPMFLNVGAGCQYSVPIFDYKDRTQIVVPAQYAWAAAQQTFGVTNPQYKWWDFLLPASQKWKPTMVPFNPAWMPPKGSGLDRTICVVDYTNGNVWEYWMVGDENGGLGDSPLNAANFLAVNWANNNNTKVIAMASANIYKDLFNRTDVAGRVTMRGCGLDKLVGIIRAQEILDGVIKHVINWTIATPASGPENTFRIPATRLEHQVESTLGLGSVTTIKIPNDIALPSGARFRLNLSDFDIDFLLDYHGLTSAIRRTMRIILVAMRDYGIMVTETGGWGGGVETDYGVNTVPVWNSLGADKFDRARPEQKLLDALSKRTDCWVVLNEYPIKK